MSRVEKILKVMLGRETKLPTPQSRVEELLIDLKTTYDSSSGAISGLDSRLTEAETNINNLQDDLDEEVANLAGDISENQDNIKANGTAIQTLQERVDRIQNPLIIKDIVDTVMGLPMEAEPGWVYFVRFTEEGDENDHFEEFVYTTDSQWESLGPMKVDLVPYVKFTDYATNDKAGVVKFGESNNAGLTVDSNGVPSLAMTDETSVKEESNTKIALHPNNIPMFMSNYGIESKTFIADNFVKRIWITNNKQNTYVKIAEITTGESLAKQCAFVLTGGANFGGYEVPVLLVTINERDATKPSRAILLSGTVSSSPEIVLKRSEGVNMQTTEVFVHITSHYPSDINIIILEKFYNSMVSFFYDPQKVDTVDDAIKIPIETVTTSSDFATTEEVTDMLTEVFDTSVATISEEASDMEVLSYEE